LAKHSVVLGLGIIAIASLLVPSLAQLLPERPCQVQSSVLHAKGRSRAAWDWGIELGLGVRTFIVTPGFHALLAVAVGQHHALMATLVCATYGLVRGLTIAYFAVEQGRHGAAPEHSRRDGIGLAWAFRTPLLALSATGAILAVI
jgi:hypothetical protein